MTQPKSLARIPSPASSGYRLRSPEVTSSQEREGCIITNKIQKEFSDNKRKKERSRNQKGREIILISRYAVILGAINTVYTLNWTILYVNYISAKLEGKKEKSHSQNIIERCFTVPGENVKIS